MPERRADAVYYSALVASFVLGLWTLWSVDYLPTNDGPQHIFLGHAENHYADPNATIYQSQLIPQLQFAARGFALYFNPLEPLLGYRDATRVVLSLFYSWSFAGYVLLVHALGTSRRWLALLGSAVPLCWPLYMGLFPYYGGLGLGLLLLGYVARRPTFDRRAAVVVGFGLALQFVHHAFSTVPTALFLCILVAVRSAPPARRETLVRLGMSLFPLVLGLLLLVWIRPQPEAGGVEKTHWEPIARRALILPRVLWSGEGLTRWLGNALLVGGLVASLVRFRRLDRSEGRTERAFILCAWTAAVLLIALPIVIPGWQFFNVRFAPFLVAFALPLVPVELLRRPVLQGAASALAAACFIFSAFGFHRSLRAACADNLAGLSVAMTRSAYRLPVVLDPFCGLPRDATKAPVPFLGPARALGGLYATAQGGTVPNPFIGLPAIHPFTARRGDAAPRVPVLNAKFLLAGEDDGFPSAEARGQFLQTISIYAQSYEDVLLFGATDADVATLGELGFRTAFRQRTFALMVLQPCQTEVHIQDHKNASVIAAFGGLVGNTMSWELPLKPGREREGGEIVSPVPQRLCGPAWLRVVYRIGETTYSCSGTADGKVMYVAKPGEITQVRCVAPDL